MVRRGEISAPIVIGRAHLNSGSVASPNRKTEAMKDGSDAVSDWPQLNALLNTASGATYAEIAAAGGGIISSVNATRHASEQQLLESARRRIHALRQDGVIALEIKSGYRLSLQAERKMLRVIRQLAQHMPLTIYSTCLAAHVLPPEYQGRHDDYIDAICDHWLPELHAEGLVDAVDAFCKHLAFSPAQVERVFVKAQQPGLPVKLHAEQLSLLHGAGLAARYNALSADHLEYLCESDIDLMAQHGTTAVLLPGAFYLLRESKIAPTSHYCVSIGYRWQFPAI